MAAIGRVVAAIGDVVFDAWPHIEDNATVHMVVATTAELYSALVAADPPRAAELAAQLRQLTATRET